MLKYPITTFAIAFIYLLLACCSKKQAEEVKPDLPPAETPGTTISYASFVQPLLQSKCAGCHAPGRSAAAFWTFNGYTSVNANADRIKNAVLVKKTMPPGGVITAAELQSLQTWFDQGTLNN